MKYAYFLAALLFIGLSIIGLFIGVSPVTGWATLTIGSVYLAASHILARIDGAKR